MEGRELFMRFCKMKHPDSGVCWKHGPPICWIFVLMSDRARLASWPGPSPT